jgi:PIN domain nuclease of toxin-antitoxin system
MNLLLDTHVLLWWLGDESKLSKKAKEAIASGENRVFVSAVSIWEIVIKEALGKLQVPRNFREVLNTEIFLQLDITANHAFACRELPPLHRDPFDRLLIAQALVERFTLISSDSQFRRYKIPLLPT